MAQEMGLTQAEVERAGVIGEVTAGRMKQRRAAEVIGVSVRQVKRLVRAFRAQGAVGLRSRRRGRPGNRRQPDELRAQVLALVRERYVDFGPTLLAEYLARYHTIRLAPETLRQWLIAAGLWRAKACKRHLHRARARRPRFGELVQIDGSPHAWFEDRGPRCTMIVFIDDATSRVLYARFVEAETTRAYFDGFAAHWRSHGTPLAYYSDRHSIFRVNLPDAEAEPTQAERALASAGIELICAHSPQAKGRVERAHRTLQDRLVKALRLADIANIDAANAFLATYLTEHNRRFAKPAHDAQDAHRPLTLAADDLDRVLSLQHTRVVDAQGAVRFDNHAYQIAPAHQPRRLVGRRITVIERSGGIELREGKRTLGYTAFDLKRWRARIADRKVLDARLDRLTAAPRKPAKPAPNHPWNRAARIRTNSPPSAPSPALA